MDGGVGTGPHVQGVFDAEPRRRRDFVERNSSRRLGASRRNRRNPSPDNFAPLVDPFELPRMAVTSVLSPRSGEAATQSD